VQNRGMIVNMISGKCQKVTLQDGNVVSAVGLEALVIIQYSVLVRKGYRKSSGIKGNVYKVMKSFICRGCMNPLICSYVQDTQV